MKTVKIGKTTYKVLEITTDISEYGIEYRVLEIKKANTTKTLIYNLNADDWTLYSGYVGLPKMVEPELNFELFDE